MELLEVNMPVPAERRGAADRCARAIAAVLNEKSKEEAGTLVRRAMQRAANETLAQRRGMQEDQELSNFSNLLKESEGRCFIVQGEEYLTPDGVQTSLEKTQGAFQV